MLLCLLTTTTTVRFCCSRHACMAVNHLYTRSVNTLVESHWCATKKGFPTERLLVRSAISQVQQSLVEAKAPTADMWGHLWSAGTDANRRTHSASCRGLTPPPDVQSSQQLVVAVVHEYTHTYKHARTLSSCHPSCKRVVVPRRRRVTSSSWSFCSGSWRKLDCCLPSEPRQRRPAENRGNPQVYSLQTTAKKLFYLRSLKGKWQCSVRSAYP